MACKSGSVQPILEEGTESVQLAHRYVNRSLPPNKSGLPYTDAQRTLYGVTLLEIRSDSLSVESSFLQKRTSWVAALRGEPSWSCSQKFQERRFLCKLLQLFAKKLLLQAMELLEPPLIHGSIRTLKDNARFTNISVTHYCSSSFY